MFRNVVSTQDLLSDSQRSTYSSDSALFSLSQRQQSQSELSQVRTQDLFTQNPNTGSQSESSFPPSRKMSMYDKWMSKGAMFRKDLTKGAGTTPIPGQPQSVVPSSRARDAEDRDIMQQVVNIVQDCNKEMKSTLTAVREKLESQSQVSGEKLTDTMKAFLEDLWQHEDRLLKAVEEGRQMKEQEQDFLAQIAAKEAVIQQLQNRLQEQQQQQQQQKDTPQDLKQVAKAVRQEMLSPQLAMENKLMEILEVTREVSEQHSHQLSQFQRQVTTQAKDCREWKSGTHKLLKDMEKRLQKEVWSVRQELQKEEEEWRNSLQEHLQEACSTHTQDLERVVEAALTEFTNTIHKQGTTSTATTTTPIINAVKKELQTLLQKQTKGVEKSLQSAWQRQQHTQQQQLQHLQHTVMSAMTESLRSITDVVQSKDTQKNNEDPPLTAPVFEEKIDQYHTDLKQQLEEMQKHHMEEVKRLQKETSGRVVPSTSIQDPFGVQTVPSLQDGGSKARDYPLQRRIGVARISPLSQQARANLFSKAKPSPVVAVLPRQHSLGNNSARAETIADSDNEVIFSQQLADSGSTATGKRRKGSKRQKKRGGGGKKRRAAEKAPVKGGLNPCYRSENMRAMQQLAIYNFSDDASPEHSRQLVNGFRMQNCEDQRNNLCSPSASTESCLSSPAVSVTVDTELVWVRRSRWSSRSATSSHSQCSVSDQRTADMLSSPFMTTSASQRPRPQLQVEGSCTNLSRTRSGRKRVQ